MTAKRLKEALGMNSSERGGGRAMEDAPALWLVTFVGSKSV